MTEEVRMVVACVNANGQSDLVPVEVVCTPSQRSDMLHIEAVEDYLLENDYGRPMLSFDDTDSHWNIFSLFNWGDNVPVIKVFEVR